MCRLWIIFRIKYCYVLDIFEDTYIMSWRKSRNLSRAASTRLPRVPSHVHYTGRLSLGALTASSIAAISSFVRGAGVSGSGVHEQDDHSREAMAGHTKVSHFQVLLHVFLGRTRPVQHPSITCIPIVRSTSRNVRDNDDTLASDPGQDDLCGSRAETLCGGVDGFVDWASRIAGYRPANSTCVSRGRRLR